ncbi:hypothetical protein [Rhodovulum euryhalinum]|uniref:Uncharacterized protein n=1 Tax=Rhodovulum euryhalinum TaxID=35805 RepID=A0A4R2K7V1_9RHOB|nr:hypothetical protein [Rhodovulum euryhalinum]TCO69443.1 hypothetical protein EV655_11576 [Rhodovulum euryhalinum]
MLVGGLLAEFGVAPARIERMIEGRGGSAVDEHASESFAFEADAAIDNSGCLEWLEAQALEIALG